MSPIQNDKLIVTPRNGQGGLYRVFVHFAEDSHETFLGYARKEDAHWTCADELAALFFLPHARIKTADLAQYLTKHVEQARVREKVLRKMEW